MSEHAILPPSSAKEWSKCEGWLVMNEATPEPPETDEARWGTECHGVAEHMLVFLKQGQQVTRPPGIDDEMWETAELYAKHCHLLMQQCMVFGGEHLGIESKLKTDIPQVWGTCDFYLYHAQKKTLYIRDFKAGHLIVEPDDPQILLYARGVMEKLGLLDLETVLDLGVAQPRGFHRDGPIRTVRMWAHELRAEYNSIAMAADGNLRRDRPVTAGAHCYQCKARTRCPAAIAAAQSFPYAISEAIPADLQPAEVGLLLRKTRRAIKFLEQMEKAYAGEVEGQLRAGHIVPGWGMETQYARSKEWTVPEEQVLLLGQLYGKDLSKPGLITPTQAEKLVPAEIINGYCTRRKTGVKLSETNGKQIANIFGAIKI